MGLGTVKQVSLLDELSAVCLQLSLNNIYGIPSTLGTPPQFTLKAPCLVYARVPYKQSDILIFNDIMDI